MINILLININPFFFQIKHSIIDDVIVFWIDYFFNKKLSSPKSLEYSSWDLRANGTKTYAKAVIYCFTIN